MTRVGDVSSTVEKRQVSFRIPHIEVYCLLDERANKRKTMAMNEENEHKYR
jgi:hypothetical protein